jgi:spore maturation protein SpmB
MLSERARYSLKGGAKKGWEGFVWMAKIIIPVSFLTALLEYNGLLYQLNSVLEPVMNVLNLPPVASLPIVVGMLTGIYTGIAAMVVLPLTVEEMTLIAVFIMISHNLIQETIIQAKSGLGATKATLVRLTASVATVIIVSQFLKGDAQAEVASVGTLSIAKPFLLVLKAWFFTTIFLFIKIFVIIIVIMIVMEIMRTYKWIDSIVKVLNPFMRLLGLEKKVALLWLTAVVFGLSYGAAVIVNDARNGSFTQAELESLHISIGINHAIIEDPAIFLSLGLNPFWLWVPRFITAIIAVHIFSIWQTIRDGKDSPPEIDPEDSHL